MKKRKTRRKSKASTSRKLKAAEQGTSKKKTGKARKKGTKKLTGKKRILAVGAVQTGNTVEHHINSVSDIDPTFVRRYINGLIQGLLSENLSLGQDYDIWYRHILHSANNGSFAPGLDHTPIPNDLIFAMSGQVVDLALTQNFPPVKTSIVFPSVSFPNTYTWNPLPRNVAGINALRSQTAGDCFKNFLQTVPTLKTMVVGYLCCPGYPPSDVAEDSVKTAAQQIVFPLKNLKPIPVTDQNLMAQLSAPPPPPAPPPYGGLLVLPVDFCFAAAGDIINTVQQTYKLPTFFPIPDWVQPTPPQMPALGAYGVSQFNCGYLAASIVSGIWGGASPAAFGAQQAPRGRFDWLVSQSAATALNIKLNVQNIVASGGTIVP